MALTQEFKDTLIADWRKSGNCKVTAQKFNVAPSTVSKLVAPFQPTIKSHPKPYTENEPLLSEVAFEMADEAGYFLVEAKNNWLL